jgi:prepilin-type N-terminal cleavage/methylation domain-containing protein
MNETKKGFTIIELIVTIVVIGILVTIMIVSYNGIQQRSRDSQRTSDVTKLKIALEKYHADKGQYPAVCSADDVDCPADSLTSVLVSNYIALIPHDPINAIDSATDYRYIRGAVNPDDSTPGAHDLSDSYGILVTYEAKAVCKTGVNINSAWWGSSIPTC